VKSSLVHSRSTHLKPNLMEVAVNYASLMDWECLLPKSTRLLISFEPVHVDAKLPNVRWKLWRARFFVGEVHPVIETCIGSFILVKTDKKTAYFPLVPGDGGFELSVTIPGEILSRSESSPEFPIFLRFIRPTQSREILRHSKDCPTFPACRSCSTWHATTISLRVCTIGR